MVRDDSVSVKISLTSPLLREAPENVKAADDITATNKSAGDAALLPRQPCLRVTRFGILSVFDIQLEIFFFRLWLSYVTLSGSRHERLVCNRV